MEDYKRKYEIMSQLINDYINYYNRVIEINEKLRVESFRTVEDIRDVLQEIYEHTEKKQKP